jgi:hypothetical protein
MSSPRRRGKFFTWNSTRETNDAQFSVTRDESSQGLASATRAWSGPLPVTGDYRIVVDGTTETAAQYALKISIK